MQIKLRETALFALIICVILILFSTNRSSSVELEVVTLEPEVKTLDKENTTNNNTIENIEEPIIKEPSFLLSDYERWVAECIVMGESGSEPYDGQILVAQCIVNACLKDGLQPSEVRTKYKYSGWKQNPTESVKNAVSSVFDDGYRLVDEYILYFYAPKYSKGRWHETQRFVIEVGGHRFFAEWDS